MIDIKTVRFRHALRIDAARTVNGQVSHLRARSLEHFARCQHRRMLDPGSDDVVARAISAAPDPPERRIV
jgi:hypothetical protein